MMSAFYRVGFAFTMAGLALPSLAEARIVAGVGIRGVQIGMKSETVRDKLGQPERGRRIGHRDDYSYRLLVYDSLDLEVEIDAQRLVNSVYTRSPGDRTQSGLGVGTRKAGLLRDRSNADCGPYPPPDIDGGHPIHQPSSADGMQPAERRLRPAGEYPNDPADRYCYLSLNRRHFHGTWFMVERGRVSAVRVIFLPAVQ